MTTTSVPDRGPVSVFSSMLGLGRLLRRCRVFEGTSDQYHPYIGEVTVTEVTSEGTLASTAKIPVTANKMAPITFTVQAAVSELDVDLPGFKPALDEAIIKALTNAIEGRIALECFKHAGTNLFPVLTSTAKYDTMLGNWINLGDQVDLTDAVLMVARDYAIDIINYYPAQDRMSTFTKSFGAEVFATNGLASGTGVLVVGKSIHVVFYGEPRVYYDYTNPLLPAVTGRAHVGIGVMGNTAEAFQKASA